MTEALLLVVVGSLVPVCMATLVVALLALRKAHLYVELAEQRLEYVREGQLLLMALLREQGRTSEEQEQSTREEHHAEGEDRVQQERDRLALAVRAQRRAERRHAERGIGGSEKRSSRSPFTERLRTDEKSQQKGRGTETQPRAANFPDTTTSKPAKAALPDGETSVRAVWHPHPDDDVSPARKSKPGDAAVEMFRRHYDKYLDNYEGYVKLAARLHRMRQDAEVHHGSAEESEWEGRLRRVTDGIQRTTARLDILEEYNPELATDDRISRRAAIARSQREMQSPDPER
jgi:hypothetical protein